MNLSELRALKPQILAIAAQYGVSNIRVFGSVARGDADADSDVDLLVDMEKGKSLFDFVRCKRAIEETIGATIDLVEDAALSNALMKASIWEDAVVL